MRSPDDDGLRFTPMTLAPIDVDVDGLKDFRSFLIRELDTNLKPGAQGITNDHGMGAQFGIDNAGAQVQAARKRYAETLQISLNNLAQYVSTAEILIEAIQTVATKYTDADLSAQAASDAVGRDLLIAVDTAARARDEAIQREADQETQRELNRMRAGTNP
jgi:hypothetical protein